MITQISQIKLSRLLTHTLRSLKAWSKTTLFKQPPPPNLWKESWWISIQLCIMNLQWLSLIFLELVFEIPTTTSKTAVVKKREGTTLSFLLFCQFMNQSLNESSEMNSPGSAGLLPCQSFWFCRFTRTAGLSVKWEYKHKTFSSINFTPLCEKTSWEGYVLFHHLYFGNSLDSCYCFLTRLLQSSHFR